MYQKHDHVIYAQKHLYESGNKRKGMRCTEQIYVWQRQETIVRTPPFVRYLA